MMADQLRLRRLRRWSRGVVALALLALVGVAVAFQPAIHWIVERELTSTLDARVRIERLRVSPFTGSLHAADLTIRDKQSGQPLLHIHGLDIEVGLRALWQREFLVSRLGVDQPEVEVVRADSGTSGPATGRAGPKSPYCNREPISNFQSDIRNSTSEMRMR